MIERFNHSLSSECPLKHSSVVSSFNLMWPEQIFLLIMNMMNAWRKSQKRHCSSDDVTRKDPPLLFLFSFFSPAATVSSPAHASYKIIIRFHKW